MALGRTLPTADGEVESVDGNWARPPTMQSVRSWRGRMPRECAFRNGSGIAPRDRCRFSEAANKARRLSAASTNTMAQGQLLWPAPYGVVPYGVVPPAPPHELWLPPFPNGVV